MSAAPGEVLAIVGPSGCGKTTLLELVCGLQQPDSGTIESEPAVLMPQRDLLLPWLSAVDNAALALRIGGASRARARAWGSPFRGARPRRLRAARPHELSGGMRQRVAFLRTLLSGKPVLCLDEPFGALDAITRQEMQEWLTGALVREPRTVVLVTHDVEEAIVLADRVAILSPARAAWWRSLRSICPAPARPHRPRRDRAAPACCARSTWAPIAIPSNGGGEHQPQKRFPHGVGAKGVIHAPIARCPRPAGARPARRMGGYA